MKRLCGLPSCGSWFNTITTLPATFTPAKSSYWYSGAEMPYPANTSGASTETSTLPWRPIVKSGPKA